MASLKKKIIVVVGPTASGKSALAVAIARFCRGEVVSADSRQVYKGLDLGTGKVTKKEMRGVPHHLLDVADPKRQFSVARYVRLARRAIRDIESRGNIPIVCGGTALYIDTLLGRVSVPEVPPDPVLRKELSFLSAHELFERLCHLDPVRAKGIDAKNPHRLIRAIEIATALGSVPPPRPFVSPWETLFIGIRPDKDILAQKIHDRLRARLKRGMKREVARLHEGGLSYRRMEELGLEYRYLKRYFTDDLSWEDMIQTLDKEIRAYTKRQMTWWKRDKSIHWYTEGQLSADMKERIRAFLK